MGQKHFEEKTYPLYIKRKKLKVIFVECYSERLLELNCKLVQYCVENAWNISERSRDKNGELLSITSEATVRLLLPTKLFSVF